MKMFAAVFGIAVFCLASSGIAGTPPDAVDGAALADQPPGEWLALGRDYSDQHYSPLDRITDQNVGSLGLSWFLDTGSNRGIEAAPLFADGVLYLSLPWSDVIAVDARSGKEIWRFDAQVPKEWGVKACCDVVNRGVSLWKGKIYVGTLDGRLVALDAKTGKPIFDVNTIDRSKPYAITGAPRVMKGKVLIGNAGGEYGVRGYVSAYDAETGALVWRFYTVPGDPGKGFENDAMRDAAKTWKGKWWKYGGGGTVWNAMSFDPKLNLAYVGTGNGAVWSKNIRSPGGGDNLYVCSILALDIDTGRLKWFYQETPGDNWDFDATQPLVQADLLIGGVPRAVIMQAAKSGFLFVLDRRTGEFISAEPYVKQNWAKAIDKKTGRVIESAEVDWEKKPALIYPSPQGGHSWQPTAYSPKTGLLYIPAMDFPSLFKRDENFHFVPGDLNTGLTIPDTVDSPPEVSKGLLLAWNPVTQKAAWHVDLWGFWNGGTLATAGNLVFEGTGDGKFVAYRAATGEKLWEASPGTGIISAPISYELDGAQYVTVVAGWGGSGALVLGRAAKAAGQISYGRILSYRLGGSAPPPPLVTADAPPPPPPEPQVSLAVLKAGERLFHRRCAVCHGFGAVGGGEVPDLRYLPPEVHAQWDDIVLNGALKAEGMVGWSKFITKPQADAIHAYVIHRANEGDIAKEIRAKPDPEVIR